MFLHHNIERPDYHRAITIRERSSRYIRTAFDYFRLQKGEEQFSGCLEEVGISPNGSIYKHIYDDSNWNSYQLEVYLYTYLMNKFDDPFRAVWEFGVASGSGRLDQKDNLFAFKIRMAPIKVLIKRISETTEMVSRISQTSANLFKGFFDGRRKMDTAEIIWDYVYLPKDFEYPHWSSIVSGYGIVYGLLRYRKGLETDYNITHWPILPSDLPHFHGKHYIFDKRNKNVIETESGKVVGNARTGPFELEGVVFNYESKAVCTFTWRAESITKKIARATYLRPRLRKEENKRIFKEQIIEELNTEYQKKNGIV